MPGHRRRMGRLGRVAALHEWLGSQGAQPPGPDEDPELYAAIRDQWSRARALLIVQNHNGTGLPVDSAIREFHAEYNNRALNHGLNMMPLSFNVAEAFFDYMPELGVFRLRRQNDYLFRATDFLDRLTLDELPVSIEEASSYFENGVVYIFESLSDPADLQFSVGGGKKIGIAGASIVRHEGEVSVLLLAGQDANFDAETKSLQNVQTVAALGKQAVGSAPDLERLAVPLPSRRPLWRTLAFARFEIAHATQHVGYVMHDTGDSYISITNDPAGLLNELGEFPDASYEETFRNMVDRMRDYSILFELCSILLYLPLYFEKYGGTATEERYKTTYGKKISDASYAAMAALVPAEERLAFRRATRLTSTGQHVGATSSQYRAPEFKIERSGYWRKLTNGSIGADREGRPAYGRTWVEKQLTWVEESVPQEPIAVVREQSVVGLDSLDGGTADPGWVYVARSAAHPREVFKIGLTRRDTEVRALELSRATGLIDGLLIVHEWAVSNCAECEAQIHARLGPHRINPNREFFGLPLKEIVRTVEEVIAEQFDGGR